MDAIKNRFTVVDMECDSDSESEVMHLPSLTTTPPYPPFITGKTPPHSPFLGEEHFRLTTNNCQVQFIPQKPVPVNPPCIGIDTIMNRFSVLDMESESESELEVKHPPSLEITPSYISNINPSHLPLSEDNRFKSLINNGFIPVFNRNRERQ